jgi:predicted RNA-binding Zn ribbon-like protein
VKPAFDPTAVTRSRIAETTQSRYGGYIVAVAYSTIDLVHPALDLVNSRHGTGPDLLEDEAWLAGFLARWGYDAAGPAGEQEREKLASLRALLRRVVEAVAAGRTPASTDVERLNRVLAGARLTRELAPEDGLRLVPVRRNWAWVLSDLAGALGELLGGETDRLKVCDNFECRFAFYDSSKNRTRRWCSHTTCGNRNKLRAFRERQRSRTGSGRYSASR